MEPLNFVCFDIIEYLSENPKNAQKNAQKSSKNFKPSIDKVITTRREKDFMCLLAVLVSQVFVVNCKAAIFPYGGFQAGILKRHFNTPETFNPSLYFL